MPIPLSEIPRPLVERGLPEPDPQGRELYCRKHGTYWPLTFPPKLCPVCLGWEEDDERT